MATDFAVFILTHGRARNVKTYATLRKQSYTGPIYLIIDNEDDQADEYRRNYGDQVIQFDKAAEAARCDVGDNFPKRNTVLFARNACFQIARDLGVEYFLQLDDDYVDFRYKFTSDLIAIDKRDVLNLDHLFAVILDYYKSIPALTIAVGQGGDFPGGHESGTLTRLWLKRKVMNTFFCSVDRPFQFTGRMNDDVNTFITLGNRGGLMFTIFNVAIQQLETQSNDGGLTVMYLDLGTFAKSFYTVMYAPSCIGIREITGAHHQRIHHRINWDAAVPKIMNERYRKASASVV
jgi:hypothetical protein